MFELSNRIQLLRDKLASALYFSLAIALGVTAWYHQLLGHYDQILWPALTSPFLLVLAVVRFIQPDDALDLTPYPVLILLGCVLINTGQLFDPLYRQWLYMLPVFAYFILPVKQASISLLVFFILFLLLRNDLNNGFLFSDMSIHLALFAGISFVFAYTQEKQTLTLEQLSGKDSLTGAFTAALLDKRLEAEVARAKETKRPLSALQVTLAELDEYTSQHGEYACRQLIKKVSHIMQASCRTGDELYRISHNSLLFLLPNTSTNGSIVLKERVWQQLSNQVDMDNIIGDIKLNPATLQSGEDANYFLNRTLSIQNKPIEQSL